MNFFHLVSCNCGDDDSFMSALYPYQMAWGGPPLEDQALFAYSCFIFTDQLRLHAEMIWPRMAYGWTAKSTLDWIWYMLENRLFLPIPMVADEYDGPQREMARGDLVLFGDPYCRIKSVYTATDELPMGWFRLL